MKEYSCKDCIHFRQHYILSGETLMKVYCGHCTCARSKKKKPDTAICANFLLSQSDTSAFVSKSYLTKELLQFVLDMELLPEIKEYVEEE